MEFNQNPSYLVLIFLFKRSREVVLAVIIVNRLGESICSRMYDHPENEKVV